MRSASVKLSVPGLDVSSAGDPVMSGCSATVPNSGPLVIVTSSLAPTAVTVTVWAELVLASETVTL